MTSIDVRTDADTVREGTTDAHSRKSTLFCPRCDHRSPVNGDWRVEREEREIRYVCPVCAEVVAVH